MGIDARTGNADLAGIGKDAARHARNSQPHVRIGHDDSRRLAAKLQRQLLQVALGGADDHLAHFGRAGKRHLVDIGMGRQCRADHFAETGDEVDDAFRQPRLQH
ncbi:hypothetical protein D3C87_1612290 [compost metagenome]